MSHYKSNLRDTEFNLFEVHRIQDYIGSAPWPDLDRDTATDTLAEVERLAREEFAASYIDQDRIPLELVDGEVEIPESIKA
ncbi:MAG: acyl-CoA dehydrogenase family protein, partial [Acidimicrobiia bacterium]